jgi:hypothetical protein
LTFGFDFDSDLKSIQKPRERCQGLLHFFTLYHLSPNDFKTNCFIPTFYLKMKRGFCVLIHVSFIMLLVSPIL